MKNLIMIPHIMDEKELNAGGMIFVVKLNAQNGRIICAI